MPSFISNKDMIAAKFKKKRVTWLWTRPF